ncbi:MAG: mannonate dehydratase [Anaerolineae bacterium]|nr:mannonate dehydratase [Anaerolineae bacterium]
MDKMRLALGQFNEVTEDKLLFAKQLGVEDIQLNTPKLPGDSQWEFMDLLRLRTRIEDAGLRLIALENVPVSFYIKIMLNQPGADEQLEHMANTIRHMGKAGIPILGYHWLPNSVWRTSSTTPARGGARVTSFDMALVENAPLTHGRVYTADEMWANWETYITTLLPVAEEAGVTLALHPDDPPVPSLGGIARIFGSFEGFKKAMEIGDSPNHGLDFCHGCWSEMGTDVLGAIRYFGSRGKLLYIHFRDVKGTVPCFDECFIDEGNMDMFEVMKTLKEVGFKGFMLTDHVPHMVEDSGWGHRSRAYAIGYMKAMLEVVNKLYP